MAKFCIGCGSPLPPEAQVCLNCGAPVRQNVPAPAAPAPVGEELDFDIEIYDEPARGAAGTNGVFSYAASAASSPTAAKAPIEAPAAYAPSYQTVPAYRPAPAAANVPTEAPAAYAPVYQSAPAYQPSPAAAMPAPEPAYQPSPDPNGFTERLTVPPVMPAAAAPAAPAEDKPKKSGGGKGGFIAVIIVLVLIIAGLLIYFLGIKPGKESGDDDTSASSDIAAENETDSADEADSPDGGEDGITEEEYNEAPGEQRGDEESPIFDSDCSVGDIITFGSYEQDNDLSNGKEETEWQVLAKEDNKILVISKYALDCQPYNTSYTDVTWESCSLRKWLNGTFLNNAFSSEEQGQIISTKVSADKNPKYSTNPGNATTDKVFLLSITEAEKYFTTDESRECAPTAYAKAQGAWTSDDYKTASGEATGFWWLRSPGDGQYYAATVDDDGLVCCIGYDVDDVDVSVRPALWISLDS